MIKKILIGLLIIVVIIIAGFLIFVYPTFSKMLKTQTIKCDDSLTLVLGGGGNSGILVTDSAVVVIDTKMMKPAEKLAEKVKKIAGKKKIIVINTHFHPDHINGNKFYPGSQIYIGNYDKDFLKKNVDADLMPNMIVTDSIFLTLGRDTLLLYNVGQAHTMDDVVVYIKNRKLLFSGDLIFNKRNPVLNKASNANIDKWIKVLDFILSKDITTIVPGHGEPGGKEIAASLKEYFTDMETAAKDPDKASELKAKYRDWETMSIFASPDKTISYIKENK